jgi:hypothetical protein
VLCGCLEQTGGILLCSPRLIPLLPLFCPWSLCPCICCQQDQEGTGRPDVHTQLACVLASSNASSSSNSQGGGCSRTARVNPFQNLDHRLMQDMAELRQLYHLATEANWHNGAV